LASWLADKGHKTAAYHAGLSPEERRAIESAWLKDEIRFVVCTSAFGMGINKPDVRWVVHFHAPVLLSEYVQEVGRAGRDGLPAEALTLVSEPTGWLDPEDRQRQQFFQNRVRSLQKKAQHLAQQLPSKGDVKEVSRQFKDGAIALAMLHSSGQLEWQDPFHYKIHASPSRQACDQEKAARQMQQYLTTSECRWKFLLQAFGFSTDAATLRCGHCDRCLPK
jgi:ATP-dependent DNA helicase RecQ